MTRRNIRALVLLMRDARGRFLRIRATLAEMARTIRPARPAEGVQLTLWRANETHPEQPCCKASGRE